MRKLLLSLVVLTFPQGASGAVHVMRGDPITTSSVTLTGAGLRFPDGTVQISSAASVGSVILLQPTLQSGATFYTSSGTVTNLNVSTLAITSSGGLRLKEGGIPAGVAGQDIFYGDSGVNWPVFNPNNTSNYFVMGSSITPVIGHCPKFAGNGGSIISSGQPCGTADVFNGSSLTITGAGTSQVVFEDSSQLSPAGKYRILSNSDFLYFMSRDSADTSNVPLLTLSRFGSTAGGTVTMSSSGTSRMSLLFGANSGNFVGFRASQTATSNVYVLPSSSGTAGQALLTDGSNNLYFGSVVAEGGGGSGTINLANGLYIPYYSAMGSSNTLSGSPGISVTTITATGLVTIATMTASSATITVLNINGAGAGELDLVEGAAPSGIAGADVLYADSTSNSLKVINNNGVAGQVVLSTSAPTTGNIAVWSADNTLVDGGSGGGGGNPTSLLTAAYGIVVTTLTVSSNTVLSGATFYQGGPIKMGGNFGAAGAATSLFINAGNNSVSGGQNILIGSPGTIAMGDDLTTGSTLTCIGNGACAAVTTAGTSVAYGYNALAASTSSANTVAIGPSAMVATTRGSQNTAVGASALLNNLTGANNTAIGYQACVNSGASTALNGGICLGYQSTIDTANTMAVGSIASPITDLYMNSKSQTGNAVGQDVAFHSQSSSGTNRVGGSFTITTGQSSGAGGSGAVVIKVSTSTVSGTQTNALVSISSWTSSGQTLVNGNHFNVTNATQPTLSSCGTAPSVIGTDTAFTITAGSAASGCVATFTKAFTNTPTCVVSSQAMSVVNALAYAVSATAVTLTQTSMSGNYDVLCFGHD